MINQKPNVPSLFHSLNQNINNIDIDDYELDNLSNQIELGPTFAYVLDILLLEPQHIFSYQAGLNLKIERVLTSLEHLYMIDIIAHPNGSQHIFLPDRTIYVQCTLTPLGRSYAQTILKNPKRNHRIQALENFAKILFPSIMLIDIFSLSLLVHNAFVVLFMVFLVLDMLLLTINDKIFCQNGNRLAFHGSALTKNRFLIFCNQHDLWNRLSADYIQSVCDHFMFKDPKDRNLPTVAKYDGAPGHHYHLFPYDFYHYDA